jgi:phage FluMu protein Com
MEENMIYTYRCSICNKLFTSHEDVYDVYLESFVCPECLREGNISAVYGEDFLDSLDMFDNPEDL